MTDLSATFTALGDETRRAILAQLTRGEARLSDLAAPLPMTQTAVSKHVRVLQKAGLVEIEKRGRTRHCRLNASGFRAASRWLADYESFWTSRLHQLRAHLEDSRE